MALSDSQDHICIGYMTETIEVAHSKKVIHSLCMFFLLEMIFPFLSLARAWIVIPLIESLYGYLSKPTLPKIPHPYQEIDHSGEQCQKGV